MNLQEFLDYAEKHVGDAGIEPALQATIKMAEARGPDGIGEENYRRIMALKKRAPKKPYEGKEFDIHSDWRMP